jgi:hypothetical protein
MAAKELIQSTLDFEIDSDHAQQNSSMTKPSAAFASLITVSNDGRRCRRASGCGTDRWMLRFHRWR